MPEWAGGVGIINSHLVHKVLRRGKFFRVASEFAKFGVSKNHHLENVSNPPQFFARPDFLGYRPISGKKPLSKTPYTLRSLTQSYQRQPKH
jgi:hypothetical protein